MGCCSLSKNYKTNETFSESKIFSIVSIQSSSELINTKKKDLKENYIEIPNRMFKSKAKDRKSMRFGINGIINMNNSCFISSALQCILRIQPLFEYFQHNLYTKEIIDNSSEFEKQFLETTRNLFLTYHNSNCKSIQVEKFCKLVPHIFSGYKIGNQEDVHEFLSIFFEKLNYLLNRVKKINKKNVAKNSKVIFKNPNFKRKEIKFKDNLMKESKIYLMEESKQNWKKYLSKNKSIIIDIFQGQLLTQLKCTFCKVSKNKFDPIMYLSVPVKNEKSKNLKTINKCFDEFFKDEKISGVNCENCKKKTSFKKIQSFSKSPHFLIIQLKRFYYKEGKIHKTNHLIDFPLENLNISKYCLLDKKKIYYTLFAISCHRGNVDYGHYYTFATDNNNSWFLFNDDNFSMYEDKEKIVNENAYLLFYVKMNLKSFKRQTVTNAKPKSVLNSIE